MDFLAFLAASEAYPVGTAAAAAAVTVVRLLLPRLIPQRGGCPESCKGVAGTQTASFRYAYHRKAVCFSKYCKM
jgi:hypothetical protein